MFTEQSREKAKTDLFNIISNFSMKDYKQANYKKGKRISKKHIPYNLGYETKEATTITKYYLISSHNKYNYLKLIYITVDFIT